MKKLLTLLVAFCCLGSMNAQLVDVIVETFGTSGGTYPAGHTTYRVYARLQDPTDFMSAVYGIGAAPADPDHELMTFGQRSRTGFYHRLEFFLRWCYRSGHQPCFLRNLP
jgi:hypothetical protein